MIVAKSASAFVKHCTGCNEEESAVSFCHQLAALFPDVFYNFYLVNKHKIAKTQQPLRLEKKYAQIWNPLNFSIFSCMFD